MYCVTYYNTIGKIVYVKSQTNIMCVGDSFPVYTVDRKGDIVSDC